MSELQQLIENPFLRFFLYVVAFYLAVVIVIWALRGVLWVCTQLFMLIDGAMWFLYNPFRFFMKDHNVRRHRGFFVLFSVFFVKPLYQLTVYTLTTPARILTALYFDVVLYLLVMSSDTIDELFTPKLGKMRYKKGFSYIWRWILFLPYRFVWFLFKNVLAVLDSILMFTVSIVWPTFTMYHGTTIDAATNISQKGRWLVGSGNWGGSGIYFGRKLSTARHYATGTAKGDQTLYPLIMARVTFTMLRNCGTLKKGQRELVGRMSESGNELSRQVKWPYAATELWRSKGGGWWEYCILQRNKEGQFVKSWRIRPVGMVTVKESGILVGRLTRLWGGASHYSLRPINFLVAYFTAMFAMSGAIALWEMELIQPFLTMLTGERY